MVSVLRRFAFVLIAWPAATASLDDLAILRDVISHRASSFDTTGGNTDNVTSFAPGETHVMLDTNGPGRITHMWLTVAPFQGHWTVLRDLVLRITWEQSGTPAVEVPLGDFFALGHGMSYPVKSAPVAVGLDHRALNCYWPMPFHKHARIELLNNGPRSVRRIYYNIDYELGSQPDDAALFHALWRREPARLPQPVGNVDGEGNYVILDVRGDGHYIGTALFIDAAPGGWWGEGDEMIFIDGAQQPQLHGTGTEDYFSNAWGYNEAFSYPYYGAPLVRKREDGGSWTAVYRWHVPDPIRFRKSIRVTLETNWEDGVRNDVSSVAYWYQRTPIAERMPLPGHEHMAPQRHSAMRLPTRLELDGTILEQQLVAQGVPTRGTTSDHGKGYRNGGWLWARLAGEPIRVEVPVADDETYTLAVRIVDHALEAPVVFRLGDDAPVTLVPEGHEQRDVEYREIGRGRGTDGALRLTITGRGEIGIDALRVAPVHAPTDRQPTDEPEATEP